MEDPNVAGNEVTKGFDAKEERRDCAHDKHFVSGYAHVPEGEVCMRSVEAIDRARMDVHHTQTPRDVNMDQKTNCTCQRRCNIA